MKKQHTAHSKKRKSMEYAGKLAEQGKWASMQGVQRGRGRC